MILKGSILLLLLITCHDRIRRSIVTSVADAEYDYIVVGGGTTGAAVAGRLSENPNVKILVIEAGKSDEAYPNIRVPEFESLMFSDANWDFRTIPQKVAGQALVNKTERWPRGKILGGTSSMNHMIYHRGSPHDFDSWEDHGAKGWNWGNVEKYFVKAEGSQDPRLSPKLGRNGPLKLTKAYDRPIVDEIIEDAARELGINTTDYIESLEGFSKLVATIYRGLRINSIEAYLRDHFPERKERLHILCESRATKVLFNITKNGPVAAGVEYIKDGETRQAYARKEVILSAGVIGTPHLLLLSGIGPEEHLNEHDIPVIVNSPGVGSNLKDHVRMQYYLYSDKFPENSSMSRNEIDEADDDYILMGLGPLLNTRFTSYIHFRTNLSGTPYSASTKNRPFPEIQIGIHPMKVQLSDFSTVYDATTYKISDYADEVRKALIERDGVLTNLIMVVGLQHAKSSGSITLQSSDPLQPPLIDPAFFSNEDDVRVYVEGLRFVENLLETEKFKELNVKHVFQPYCNEYGSAPPRSTEYLECWLRQVATSEYHPCGTAKIGRESDPSAVVDERLRVRNVRHLRIADASVMPHEISGNPQGTCYMIAEKAADMIKQDWAE